ncbi:MAG: dihydropteroate synthase [Acidimicrobiia bacterium]
MSDRWILAVAACAALGAWGARPFPVLVIVVCAAAAALWWRKLPLLCCVAALVGASFLSDRALAGLGLPPAGEREFRGVAVLRSDPASAFGGVRVQLSLPGGRRVVADARGEHAAVLRAMLAGERVAITGRVRPLAPGAERYFLSRHIGARADLATVTSLDAGAPPYRVANGLRRTLARGARGIDESRRPLFLGFVLGDDRGQRAAVVDDFRASGLSHLLAVSGQNVGFVLLLAAPLLTRMRLGARLASVLVVITLFALMTRAEPSVLRASAVAAIGALAFTLGRPITGLRALAVAATVLLFVDPLLIRSLGFCLSVAASAGILLLGPRMRARLRGPAAVRETLGVTIAAQAGVIPILLPTFGGVPVASVVANVLAVPAAGLVMILGLVAGLPAGLLPDPWPAVFHAPTDALVAWVAGVARTSARLPLGEIRIPHALAASVALAAGPLAERFVPRRRRIPVLARAVACLALGVAPAVALAVEARRPAAAARIAGGGTLWREGATTVLLVDRPNLAALLPALRERGVRGVDVLVLGRADDRDDLVARLRPSTLVEAGSLPPGAVLRVGGLRVEMAGTPVRVRSPPVRLALGNRTYDVTHRALVMGILNRTTDSFFDRGAYFDLDRFLMRADQLVAVGADLLDVGGVKAGPGPEVSEQEELERVVPAIAALKDRFDLPLSVDTWRASVLDAACAAGAVVGNDISGFADPDYVRVAAKHRASVVATHIRLAPRVPDPEPVYDDLVGEVSAFLVDRARRAEESGLSAEQVMVDAGLDLGKTWEQSCALLGATDRLAALGYPVLLSASNKTFLGKLLDLEVEERRVASLGATAVGVSLGARVVRVHDVRDTRRVCDVLAAISEAK